MIPNTIKKLEVDLGVMLVRFANSVGFRDLPDDIRKLMNRGIANALANAEVGSLLLHLLADDQNLNLDEIVEMAFLIPNTPDISSNAAI